MTNRELVELLQKFPPDVEVGVFTEGGVRVKPNVMWRARGGLLILAEDDGEWVSDEDLLPVGETAPVAYEWPPGSGRKFLHWMPRTVLP